MERIVEKASILFLLCISVILPSFAIADEVNYLYDDTGRVARVSKGTERLLYQYDEVGNLISISTESSTPGTSPPVLQGISPDIFLIGLSYNVLITGQNLLTTSSITSDNPNIAIKNIAAIDTKITATLSIGSGAVPGQANITVTTSYGSASITINLYKLDITPEAMSLFPASTASMKVSLTPLATKDLQTKIYNRNPDIFEISSSVIIPSGSNANVAVKGLVSGTGYFNIGNAEATIVVFESGTSMTSKPVSVGWKATEASGTLTSKPVSVGWKATEASGTLMSKPVSVKIGSN